MRQGAEPSCAGPLQEASFYAFHRHDDHRIVLQKEKRRATRFVHEEPVVLETQEGDLVGAVVMNYSKNGLYFESDLEVPQGVIVRIRNEATMACSKGGGCRAEVRWSKRLREASRDYLYGTGVQYC